jgi:hypothetical protein
MDGLDDDLAARNRAPRVSSEKGYSSEEEYF